MSSASNSPRNSPRSLRSRSNGSLARNSVTGKTKQSRFQRAKKNLQSRTLDSRFGRKSVTAVGLGPNEKEVVAILKEAITLDKGHEYAKHAKKTVLKTAMKLHNLEEMGLFTKEVVQPAAMPFNNLAVCLLWHMERAATVREEEKINTQRLCDFFEEARKVSVQILEPMMTKKNVDLLSDVIKYLGSSGFIDKFLYDSRFTEYRDTILRHVRELLDPWLQNNRPNIPCQTYGCEDNCCQVYGGFAKHCSSCHQKVVEAEMKGPSLTVWLRDAEKYRILKSFFLQATVEEVDSNDLAFLRAVEDFSQLENKNTLNSRSRIIFRKYLSANSQKRVRVGDEVLDELQGKMASGANSSTFKQAHQDVLARLEKVFRGEFMGSEAYAMYWQHQRETN